MPRSALSRCLACLLALVAGLVVPGAPLVHGYAHHAAAAHEQEEHGSASAPGDHGVVSAPDHRDDHPHPQIGRAVATRLDLPHFVAVVPRSTIAIEFGAVARARLIVAAALPRADPAHATQLHSRAPPLG